MKLRRGAIEDAEQIADLIPSFQPELTDYPDGVGAKEYIASVSAEAESANTSAPRVMSAVEA